MGWIKPWVSVPLGGAEQSMDAIDAVCCDHFRGTGRWLRIAGLSVTVITDPFRSDPLGLTIFSALLRRCHICFRSCQKYPLNAQHSVA